MSTKLITFILSVLVVSLGSAQANSTPPKNALSESQKELLITEKALVKNPADRDLQLQYARLLKKNGRNIESLQIYASLTKLPNTGAELLFEHAELLRAEADFANAKILYLRYAKYNPEMGQYFANSCDFAQKQLQSPRNCELESVKKPQDISIRYNEQIAQETESNNISKKEAIPNQPTIPNLSPINITSSQSLQSLLQNSTLENANISYNSEGNLVAFSEKTFINENSQSNQLKQEIYFADIDGSGQWLNVRAFPYNNASYSVCSPALNEEGNILYFSSNKAGGYGEYDIYASYKVNNSWSEPVNLGALINSPGNEISPFFKAGDLFYSSDWHQGFGGFDVFRTSLHGIAWTNVENIGPCVNSTRDDYNFILDKENDGYFNSNREGSEINEGVFKTSKLILKSNIPTIGAISNDEISIKSVFTGDAITPIESKDVIQSVDDPAIGFLPKEVQATKLYFVQIAAITNYNSGAETRLKNYTKYGNVYKSTEGNVTKIRIGGYSSLNEALKLLKTLKKNGFKDVFVVADIPSDDRCVLVHKASGDLAQPLVVENEEGKLKIRVSEFKAPDWFDSSKIADLGKIEHWTKNGWTIIVIGSFKTSQDAISVLDKVKARGFKEAYIVMEENGRLYRQN
ncbi:MAG: SPOR domain-containing protein [Saprospiraceae bacterium]|nr:SPOR domain-containing protein [Saprospiraceae bacterium]